MAEPEVAPEGQLVDEEEPPVETEPAPVPEPPVGVSRTEFDQLNAKLETILSKLGETEEVEEVPAVPEFHPLTAEEAESLTPHQIYERAKSDTIATVERKFLPAYKQMVDYVRQVSAVAQMAQARLAHPDIEKYLPLMTQISNANPNASVDDCYVQAVAFATKHGQSFGAPPPKAPGAPPVKPRATKTPKVSTTEMKEAPKSWAASMESNFTKFFPEG